MADPFPHRAKIGHTDYGLDADYYDHRQRDTREPELIVTEKDDPMVIWHPDGQRYRIVDDGRVEFGFRAKVDD